MELWLLCAVLVGVGVVVDAHVALTFPPARKYNLDYLDTFRTAGPCGMPKGDLKTSVLQGSEFNVSWHLAYPHRGGFRLELLDAQERPLTDLTPVTADSKFLADDTTAQSFRVTLPNNLECEGCTIRLLRQAPEWGRRYQFWSCADVDIVRRRNYRETCSDNGRYMVSRCRCDKRFYGERCQFENECEDDDDCGFYGKCIDVEATNYPKKQCYCRQGRFGKKCSRVSLVTQQDVVNLGLYSKKTLSDKLTMHWRILRNEGEIEVVLVNKGTSYAALGWRPQGVDKTCKEFPYIPAPANYSSASGSPSEPEPEGEAEPEAEAEAEPEAEAEAEPEAEAEAEPEAEAEAEPEAEAEAEPEAEAEAEPHAEPDAEPHAEPDAEAETEPHAEPGAEAKPEAEAEAEPHREPEVEAETEPEAEAEPTGVSVKTPKQIILPDALSSPEPEVEADPEAEAEPEAETESEGDAGADGKQPSLADRLSELLVPSSNRGKRNSLLYRRTRFAVPLLKARETAEKLTDTEEGAVVKDGVQAEPEAEAEAEAKAEPLSGKTPFVPKGDFHAMDCTDIIIGSARGNFYRIGDYYTRDRSTPRTDEFWGGEGSLTAALGWEKDGETTILFRRKLEATHPTDHSITDSLMHVIWARGQEPGLYVHSPSSGLESGTPSVPDFYRPDEVKYHGKKGQRGVTAMNFMEETTNLASAGEDSINWCGGQWKYPGTCSPGKNCDYYAKWEYFENTDDIQFTVQTTYADRWTGIGFSDNSRMSLTDAVIGWVEGSGRYFMFDGWIRGYQPPIVEANQGIRNKSGSIVDGLTTLSFVRKRLSNDKEYDLSFSDDGCLYLVFPIKGGVINYVSKKIKKHGLTPSISTERVCIRSCVKYGGADGKPFVYTTPVPRPQLHYNVQLILTGLADRFKVPEKGTTEWNTMSNRIQRSVEGAIEEIPGYEASTVKEIKSDGKGQIFAELAVVLDKENHEAEAGEVAVPEGETNEVGDDSMIKQVLQESVSSGRIGSLQVDPSFLRVNQMREVSESVRENSVTGLDSDNRNPALKFLEDNKLWIILGVVGVLLLLTIIQATITITRMKKNRSPPERLITNSGWKDYSNGNMNYAYESFETEENGVNSRRQGNNGSLRPNGARGSYGRSNGHANGFNGALNGHMGHPAGYGGDTRSLQRPRNVPQIRPDPRGTYSLPRGSTTSSLPSYTTAMQEMTPDFYYLPSQRKYSGEVVRVYVDYNQAK